MSRLCRFTVGLLFILPAKAFVPLSRTSRPTLVSPRVFPPIATAQGNPTTPSANQLRWINQLRADSTPLSRSKHLLGCVTVGTATGAAVALFKLAIAALATALYQTNPTHGWTRGTSAIRGARVMIPALGGLLVAALRAGFSFRGRGLGPTLGEHVQEVETEAPLRPAACVARSAAAVGTLGTGNSLGPEGPCVEIGASVARSVVEFTNFSSRRRKRQLLAAGAAAGVAAGFNAPLAGVFFALEVASDAVKGAAVPRDDQGKALATDDEGRAERALEAQSRAELDCKSRTAVGGYVLSALLSATCAQRLMMSNKSPLVAPIWPSRLYALGELPLYIGLGLASGLVALLFERCTNAARGLFQEEEAKGTKGGGGILRWVPPPLRPALAGLVCGLVGISLYPQVLFFGYTTIDGILACGAVPSADAASSAISASVARTTLAEAVSHHHASIGVGATPHIFGFGLLAAKLALTSLCVGCGLVGGTFAPSLLLGAVLGVVYHSIAVATHSQLAPAAVAAIVSIADAPTYAMVGAAAVLASVFKAPLTATLLIFELTRGYEIVLPLLAAAGTGPLVVEWAHRRERRRARS